MNDTDFFDGCWSLFAAVLLSIVLIGAFFFAWWLDPGAEIWRPRPTVNTLVEQTQQLQSQIYELQTAVAKKDKQ